MPSRSLNRSGRVRIRRLAATDEGAFLRAAQRSRTLHQGWAKPPRTGLEFRRYLRRLSSLDHCGFVVLDRQTGQLVGVVNINNIILGKFRSGFLGYYSFAGFQGKGLMTEAMRIVLKHAFKKLKLHRLEANIQPNNTRSIALARRCGFAKEGYSRRYVKVAGKWRDHERWAILAEDLLPF